MSTRFLRYFFEPRSIAVLGASERPDNAGGMVIQNLLDSGFPGQLCAVNIKGYDQVYGVPCYASVEAMTLTPDLAIICSAPERIPSMVERLGARGVKAALILSSGLSSAVDEASGRTLKELVLEAAQPSGIRLMGPDCRGLLVPGRKMNASYAELNVKPGKVAYIGQSGTLGNAVIDWACGRGLGFSHWVTLGDSVDVQIADVIDYLANYSTAQAILLHLEQIADARHFMTAVREASRNKLVLAIKSGRQPGASPNVPEAPAGLPSEDVVWDTMFKRAGVVRVDNSEELFDALETLTRMKPLRGDRLVIMGNGAGSSILAADKLLYHGGRLAELSEATRAALSEILPPYWDGCNPINLGADATPSRYAEALRVLGQDRQVDALLVLHAPTRLAPSKSTAEAVIAARTHFKRNLLTSWMGLEQAFSARHEFNLAGIPTYLSPEKAVQAFMHMVEYQRNQALLQETPPSLPFEKSRAGQERCRELIRDALKRERDFLTHQEAGQVLEAYGINMAPSLYAVDENEAAQLARQIEDGIAVKIVHHNNCYPFVYRKHPHKLSAGLLQDLQTPDEVREAVIRLRDKVHEKFPQSRIFGYCLQQMQRGKHSLLLSAGFTRDPLFGPVIVFGVGGYKANVLSDRQVSLPPLNLTLARELISRSHASRLIREHSSEPEHDFALLAQLLVKLSQIAADQPEIKGLEINPLVLNRDVLMAVDVAIDLAEPTVAAIMPYPEELREWVVLPKSGRKVEVRPIRGEDSANLLQFHRRLSEESIRYRYFHNKTELTQRDLALLTQINYDRQMAFIAEQTLENGDKEILGVVRVWTDPDNIRTEFSIIIRDDMKGEGLGSTLMRKMIAYCRSVGTLEMIGKIMVGNHPMRAMMKRLGFTCRYNEEEEVIDAVLPLNEPVSEWQRHRLGRT